MNVFLDVGCLSTTDANKRTYHPQKITDRKGVNMSGGTPRRRLTRIGTDREAAEREDEVVVVGPPRGPGVTGPAVGYGEDSRDGQDEESSPRNVIPPLLFNVSQACLLLGGISKQLLYREIQSKHIKPVKIGTRSMFTMTELRRFVNVRILESYGVYFSDDDVVE